jgi:hypothetical protein
MLPQLLILSITFPFQLVKCVVTVYILIVNSKHFDSWHFSVLILVPVTNYFMGLNA